MLFLVFGAFCVWCFCCFVLVGEEVKGRSEEGGICETAEDLLRSYHGLG